MTNNKVMRGYIGSRIYYGTDFPQSIQNGIVKKFAEENSFQLLMSSTEYSIPDSFSILENIINFELNKIDGVIFFSVMMLPKERKKRENTLLSFCGNKKTLGFAFENLIVESNEDIFCVEDYFVARSIATYLKN